MTKQLTVPIYENDTFTDEEKAHVRQCVVTRGRREGLLKKSMPKYENTMAYAAWLAIKMAINPLSISIGSVLMLGQKERVFFEKVEKLADAYRDAAVKQRT